MVDLTSLPNPKQPIQLRLCLSLETQRLLENTLQVPSDSTSWIVGVLNIIQQLHPAIKHSEDEHLPVASRLPVNPSSTFFVRSKGISEEIDVCKGHNTDCEASWIKHGILTDVHDEELVEKIFVLDAFCTLGDVVTTCRSHEAKRSTASALRAPPTARTVSQYKTGKKKIHKMKAEARPAITSFFRKKCGKQQHAPNGCAATEATCTSCGKTGHRSHTRGCPARNAQCRLCNRYRHFYQVCRAFLPGHQQPSKARIPKPEKEPRSTFHVVQSSKAANQQCKVSQVDST